MSESANPDRHPVITLHFRRRTLWIALAAPAAALVFTTALFLW